MASKFRIGTIWLQKNLKLFYRSKITFKFDMSYVLGKNKFSYSEVRSMKARGAR